ncbi:hypothetical protein [Planktothrix paucivesiculata]|uniref:Similar to tr P73252 P73252 n=1 Tax=Planktothrix paucivesiculata PCC 9631 TaxID=671071 RepID=A0A7Z9BZF3_9CYAN|nr:hypothetical protein [Planktothrix paucivesiculata]VXD24096.1 Similar to tr/P73252/P73252 [Planktothrix paucivesiculata PCC 9631]
METTVTLTVTVNAEGNLDIPPELQTQLTPGDQYKVAITEEGLLFKKVKKLFDWEEFRRRRDESEPDPNPMTMEEICAIVKEVRHQMNLEGKSES